MESSAAADAFTAQGNTERTNRSNIPQRYDAALAGKLKAMWVMGQYLEQTDPNTGHMKKALNSLKFLIVQEIFMSETAKFANVVLPGASFFAKSGTFTNGERRVQRVNEVIPPLAGTKTDGQIVSAS